MHRFFLPPSACHGPELSLSAAEAHHALYVLRVRAGCQATVLNGAGEELLCAVVQTKRREVRLRVVQRTVHPPLPYQITLFQAVTKSKAMDWIVQKATELGIHRLVPLVSERTVARWDDAVANEKAAGWRTTCLEAARQCGAPWLPLIETPLTVAAQLARGEVFELALLASLEPGAAHPGVPWRAFTSDRRRPPKTVAVWVGPEGDFTPAELDRIRAAGALPITLGPLVLRSETAALYCLSFLSYELQAARVP